MVFPFGVLSSCARYSLQKLQKASRNSFFFTQRCQVRSDTLASLATSAVVDRPAAVADLLCPVPPGNCCRVATTLAPFAQSLKHRSRSSACLISPRERDC